MARLTFPDGFHWGTATASYQIEGAFMADGRGESIWDRFAHTPGRVKNGHTGDVACDSYHRFGEDIALMREMNLGSYRFSIAWPRVQPDGRGAANAKGLDYYRRLVDAVRAAGLRPFPTLYHWDLPQALEDAGGWPARDTAGRFAEYAEIVTRALDAVDDWMIFNEPSVFTVLGYLLGNHAPGRTNVEDMLRATHTVNLAQADAFKAMKAVRNDLRIGSAFNMAPCEPASDSLEDVAAAERWHSIMNVWFVDPPLRGRYPEAFLAGLPADIMGIEPDDLGRIRTAFDFLGINLYTRARIAHQPGLPYGLDATQVATTEGPVTDFGWEVWPDALYDMLMRVTRDYETPVLEVTENGCAYGDAPGPEGRVRDERRIDFYRGYLEAVHRAISDGADVRGYHAWSLLDNFEWAEGYTQRFGLVWMDFETQERTLKDSGRWYGTVAAENGFET
jgi:beta-glucosidase